MAGDSTTAWQQVTAIIARPGAKKSLALAVLIAVMVVMWGGVFLTGHARPRAAAASSVGRSAGTGGDTVLANPQLSQAAQALQEFTRSSIGLVDRNIFLVKLDYFAAEGSRLASPQPVITGFWDELAKSMAAKADQEKAKRILAENLQTQASRLQLQSTVMSDGAPKAMVNDTLVSEGETIGGFRVVKIEARRIIVEREGVRLEVLFSFR